MDNQTLVFKNNSNETDRYTIETFKFYISDIAFLYKDKVVWRDKERYRLIDFYTSTANQIELPITRSTQYDAISFNLGIDSATNATGVKGGDLDPTLGMYWTWQSGYINLKIEGTSALCQTRKNQFQFHLGGYQYPANCLQRIVLAAEPSPDIIVNVNLALFFEGLDLKNVNHIMTPGLEAVDLSKQAARMFSVE